MFDCCIIDNMCSSMCWHYVVLVREIIQIILKIYIQGKQTRARLRGEFFGGCVMQNATLLIY